MSRFRVIAAGMAVAALVILTIAAPASAHDELLSSTPAANEALSAAPSTVSLQFSADVLTLGAVIVIADASGGDWVAGPVEIAGTAVSAEVLPDMPNAGYELRWRVVSSDGHPIAGIVPFTVGDGAPLVREAVPDDPSAAQAGTSAQESSAPQESGIVRVVLIGVGGAVVAAALYALFTIVTRRRDRPDGTGTPDP